MQEDPDIASLIALMQHLDAARYQSFWLGCDAIRSTNLSKGKGEQHNCLYYTQISAGNSLLCHPYWDYLGKHRNSNREFLCVTSPTNA